MKKVAYFRHFKLVIMMICAIVGVGFVSGAEIYEFYVRFGKFAYLSVIVFWLLMFLLSNKILKNINDSENCVKMNNINKISQKNTFLTKFKIKSILTYFNVILVASAMFAGFFSLIKNLYFNNYILIAFVVIFFVFFVLLIGVKSLEKFDYFVFLFLTFLVIYFTICVTKSSHVDIESSLNLGDETSFLTGFCISVFYACLYVFMNIVQIQPILAEFKPNFAAKKRILFAFVFSFLLAVLLLIFVCFLKNNPNLFESEMPFLTHFETVGGVFKLVYVLGLVMALLSSLLSCLIGVKTGIKRFVKSNTFATGFSIILCLTLSLIGFSNFVKIVYPVIGVINFVIFVFL